MTKSQKFFRTLWRINAILISLAAALVVIGLGYVLVDEIGRSARHVGEKVAGVRNSDAIEEEKLTLQPASFVPGWEILRAEYSSRVEHGGKFSSSGERYETRNLLFVSPSDNSPRWLLPDHQHIISKYDDISNEGDSSRKTLATVALVTPLEQPSAPGTLILFDPSATKITEISKNVSDLQLSVSIGGRITLVYGRNGKIVRTMVDGASYNKYAEHEIAVPVLKPAQQKD